MRRYCRSPLIPCRNSSIKQLQGSIAQALWLTAQLKQVERDMTGTLRPPILAAATDQQMNSAVIQVNRADSILELLCHCIVYKVGPKL